MALQRAELKNGIIALLGDMSKKQEPSYEEYAERLSILIETYVKSGTVTVEAGIPVSTTGSATSQTGATTAPGTGTIS